MMAASSSTASGRIAIVGCGVAGMAAAIFLARQGRNVTLFERFAEAKPPGAGFLLQPTGMGVLASLGLYDNVRAAGTPIERIVGRTIHGRNVMDLPYADLDPKLYGLGVHRGVVFQALYDAMTAEPRVTLRTSAEIIGVDGRAGTLLHRASGDQAAREEGRFDLIIAANGAQSAIRRSSSAARRDRAYRWACVWTIAPEPLDDASAEWRATLDQRYDGVRRFAGILPIGRPPSMSGEKSRARAAALFWSLRADRHAKWLARGVDAWKNEMRAFWPRYADYLEAVTDLRDLTLATYRDVVARRSFVDRLVFLGDASHAMSPQLGQGANLALIDAITLAAALDRHDDVEAALRFFARDRRAQIAWYARASRWLTPMFQADNSMWGWARDRTFYPLSRLPFVRREMLAGQAGLKTGLFSRDRRDWRPGRPAPIPTSPLSRQLWSTPTTAAVTAERTDDDTRIEFGS